MPSKTDVLKSGSTEKWKSLIGFHPYNQQKCVPVEGGLEVVNRSVLWECCALVTENRLDASLIFGISLQHSILIGIRVHANHHLYTYNPHPTQLGLAHMDATSPTSDSETSTSTTRGTVWWPPLPSSVSIVAGLRISSSQICQRERWQTLPGLNERLEGPTMIGLGKGGLRL